METRSILAALLVPALYAPALVAQGGTLIVTAGQQGFIYYGVTNLVLNPSGTFSFTHAGGSKVYLFGEYFSVHFTTD